MGNRYSRANAYYDPLVSAKAGTQQNTAAFLIWIPAYAGMSGRMNSRYPALTQPKWTG